MEIGRVGGSGSASKTSAVNIEAIEAAKLAANYGDKTLSPSMNANMAAKEAAMAYS